MKFRVILKGKLLGISPVRLTPVDVVVPSGTEGVLGLLVRQVGQVPVRVGLFSGELYLALV